MVAVAVVAAACTQNLGHTVAGGTEGQAGVSVMQGCTIHLGRSGQSGYRPSAYLQATEKRRSKMHYSRY